MDDTAERICLPRLPAFKENTFCVDQADTDTVEYIRADLHQKALDRIEALEAEVSDIFQQYVDANEARIELEAENERLRSAMEWQPIETAPSDGTRIVVHNASLWLPLPELPSTQTEGEEHVSTRW